MTPAEQALMDEFGGAWGRHPEYSVDDWQYEVANGDTRLGYWTWVDNKISAEEDCG